MLIRRLAPLALLPLLACDNRAAHQVGEPDAGPRAASPDASASSCPYPDGTCDFDSDCPPDHRCEGAMRTTGVPHAFVCQGICVAEQPPTGPGNTPGEPLDPGCDPSAGPLQVHIAPEGTDYGAGGEADRAYGPLIATVRNCSEDQTYHRLLGCCGEGQPLVERLADDGTWQLADGCPPMPAVCCDAEPTCGTFAPGDGFEWSLQLFDACECGTGTFRLRFFFSRSPGCVDDALGPMPEAVSASFVPHCY